MTQDEIFEMAPDEWVLPITPPHPSGRQIYWQQQEYVTCMQCGFSFAAHNGRYGLRWHYKLPTPKGWVYLTYDPLHRTTVKNDETNPFLPKAPR